MTDFSYTVRNKDNTVQKGQITATDRASAVAALQEKQLTPILVKPVRHSKEIHLPKFFSRQGKVKNQDIVIFTRQLATMTAAGVPLLRSLHILQDQTESPAMRKVLEKVISEVEGGKSLADALEDHPETFSLVYINMVRAGEAGGILDKILNRLALQVEKEAEIKGKVKGAMIYPGVITTFTVFAFIFVMTGVVPKLGGIFEQFGGELPFYTRIMLSLSSFLISWGVFLLVALIVAIFLFRRFIKTKEGKLWFHKLLLKVPVVKTMILKVSLARFARTFSSLITAGVSILDCLHITANSINNVVIKNIILESAQEVKNGQPLSASLLKYKIIPPMLGQMTAVGEETGEIDVVLEKVAEFYEEEVDRTVNNLTSVIEPLLIVLLGSVVGIIMASVFGPLSSFSNIIE